MRASDPHKELVVTPDGWAVADFEDFRFFVDHAPPRPHVYVRQLIADAKGWPPIAFWVVGFGLIALAVITKQWPFILVGLIVLSAWFRLFRRVVRSVRDSPLKIGVIDALDYFPHPMIRGCSQASARLEDGLEVSVVLINAQLTSFARDLLEEQGHAEVLFAHDRTAEHSMVIGVRAMAQHSGN